MAPETRPFYLIAHRVLTVGGVKDALSHGANALEIDLTAHEDGWWADHNTLEKRGDRASDIFEAIVSERQAGKTITFVWFDIKTPDDYLSNDTAHPESTFDALRRLGRDILQAHGIRVLYGFYETANSAALESLRNDLNSQEAINLDGPVEEMLKIFKDNNVSNKAQRVLSKGLFNLDSPSSVIKIGGLFVKSVTDFPTIFNILKTGSQSGEFGKVFGWTIQTKQRFYADKLMHDAHVDGLIYGFESTMYQHHQDTIAAAQLIRDRVKTLTKLYRMATQDDIPW